MENEDKKKEILKCLRQSEVNAVAQGQTWLRQKNRKNQTGETTYCKSIMLGLQPNEINQRQEYWPCVDNLIIPKENVYPIASDYILSCGYSWWHERIQIYEWKTNKAFLSEAWPTVGCTGAQTNTHISHQQPPRWHNPWVLRIIEWSETLHCTLGEKVLCFIQERKNWKIRTQTDLARGQRDLGNKFKKKQKTEENNSAWVRKALRWIDGYWKSGSNDEQSTRAESEKDCDVDCDKCEWRKEQ